MGLRRAQELEAPCSPAQEPPVAPAHAVTERWTQGSSLTTRGLTVVLWAVVACGPLALATSALRPDPAPPAAVEPAPPAGEVAVVGESAVQAVRSWLTATREQPGAVMEIYPQLQTSALPEIGAIVSAASVAAVAVQAPGVWSVTVGVDATWPAEDTDGVVTLRLYFEVPVASAGDGLAASPIALPAPVAAPQRVAGVELEYRSGLSTSSELGTTVGEYLQALLTGQGDVSRYVTPGAEITAIAPAPFTGVEVRRVWATEPLDPSATPEDGQTAQVLVDAAVTPVNGVELVTQYRLQLTARAGRWEISQMQGNPAVRADADAPAPTTEGANP